MKNLVQLHDNLFVPENFEDNHVYFADAEGKKKYTGVTTILGVLNKPMLVPWAARMAVEYVKEHSGPNVDGCYDWVELMGILEEAKTAYTKKRDDGAQKGNDIHKLVEEYVNESIIKNGGKPLGALNSNIQSFVDWSVKENITFISAETPLVSEKLWVAGTADLIFEKDGKRYIGDIKTYKKLWDRTPMYQCAGYALMYQEMQDIKNWKDDKVGPLLIDGYCIINLPKERAFDEAQDVRWSFDVEGDTKAFLAAHTLYKANQNWK